jgi:hypothetical protein
MPDRFIMIRTCSKFNLFQIFKQRQLTMKNRVGRKNIQKEKEEGSGIEEIRCSIYVEDANLIKNIFTITVENRK